MMMNMGMEDEDFILFNQQFEFMNTTQFPQLRAQSLGCSFLDKSLIIERILNLGLNSTLLIQHPRRSGKSTMLSMLATFFEKPLDQTTGKEEKARSAFNRRLFFGGEITFVSQVTNIVKKRSLSPLRIAGITNQDYLALNCQLGVLSINLANIATSSHSNLINSLIELISIKFYKFGRTAIASKLLSSSDIERIRRYAGADYTYVEMPEAIELLVRIISTVSGGNRVIVLIDAIDRQISKMQLTNATKKEITEIAESLTIFLSYFNLPRCRDHVFQTVMTGIFDVTSSAWNHGLDSLIKWDVTSPELLGMLAITSEELQIILDCLIEEIQVNFMEKHEAIQEQLEERYCMQFSLFPGVGNGMQSYYHIWSVFSCLRDITKLMGVDEQIDADNYLTKLPEFGQLLSRNLDYIDTLLEIQIFELLEANFSTTEFKEFDRKYSIYKAVEEGFEPNKRWISYLLVNLGILAKLIHNEVEPSSEFAIINQEMKELLLEFKMAIQNKHQAALMSVSEDIYFS